MARVWHWSGRQLPLGRRDALKQLCLFAVAYYLYRLVRGVVFGEVTLAFDHARSVVGLERGAGLFFEPGFQHWALGHGWLISVANWCYVNSHPAITSGFLIWVYIARNERFTPIRNVLLVAMVLALVGYVVYPTAPPRMLPEWGFTDTVANWVGPAGSNTVNVFSNPYAAVPSMHVAFAVITGFAAAGLARRRLARICWAIYPALVTFAVVVTANHFWFDAASGVLVAAVATAAARAPLARLLSEGLSKEGPLGAQASA